MQSATQYAVHSVPRRESLSHTPDSEPQTPISNRHNKLLETPVTYTKQTAGPISNRYRIRFISAPLLRRKTRPRRAPRKPLAHARFCTGVPLRWTFSKIERESRQQCLLIQSLAFASRL